MVGGKPAVKAGSCAENQVQAKLEHLGFTCCRKNDEEKQVKKLNWGNLPYRYARHGCKYKSPYRPNTAAKSDWSLYVDGEHSLHIESKTQTNGGSAAAKAVTAVLELDAIQHEIWCGGVFLLLPSIDWIKQASPCDGDYYLWAMSIAKERRVTFGDIAALNVFLEKSYYEVKKWN